MLFQSLYSRFENLILGNYLLSLLSCWVNLLITSSYLVFASSRNKVVSLIFSLSSAMSDFNGANFSSNIAQSSSDVILFEPMVEIRQNSQNTQNNEQFDRR